jgi:hypothetical protein
MLDYPLSTYHAWQARFTLEEGWPPVPRWPRAPLPQAGQVRPKQTRCYMLFAKEKKKRKIKAFNYIFALSIHNKQLELHEAGVSTVGTSN